MKNIFMIIKINLLAIIEIPILGISIIAKLLQKAVEQLIVFMSVGYVLLLLLIVQSLLNSGGILNGLTTIIAFLIVFGGIIIITVFVLACFGSIVVALIGGLTKVLLAILSVVFEISHEIYSKIYDICKKDFESLEDHTKSFSMQLSCIFWYVLKAINRSVVIILSNAILISIACSVMFVGGLVLYIHNSIDQTFGIGIIEYLGLFPKTNAIFTALYFVVIVLAVVVVIITLGIEWKEWGSTLKYATQDYTQYKELMNERTMRIEASATETCTFEEGKSIQRCEEYMNIFRELGENAQYLYEQANAAKNLKDDSALNHNLIEYINNLNAISEEIAKHDGRISSDYFERNLIPMIEMAKMQSKSIEKKVFKILNSKASEPHKNDGENDLFGGCSNLDEVKKRYRSLCKVYHPDEGGHEGMFNQIQNQYEEKLVKFKDAE